MLSGSSAEVLSSRFIVKSPPISPSSSTSLRSCCEACPSHQREQGSRGARQREQKPTTARSARCELCHNHRRSQPANRVAWVCESPSQLRPIEARRLERKNKRRVEVRCILC